MATRCPELPDAVPALGPGDLNKMFERIVERAPGNRTLSDVERQRLEKSDMTEYSVKVYSRPSDESATEVNIQSDRKLPPPRLKLKVLHTYGHQILCSSDTSRFDYSP